MKTVYVASLNEYTGKSTICLSLAFRYKTQGLNVGYMKPLGTAPAMVHGVETDEDAAMIWQALDLEDAFESAVPVLLTSQVANLPLRGPVQSLQTKVEAAFKRLSRGKDIMILEGAADFAQGLSLGLSAGEVAALTNAKVVLVTSYRDTLPLDGILLARAQMHDLLIGVILNNVPREMIDTVRAELTPFLEREKLSLYGVLHRDPILGAISVRELCETLNGDILCAYDRMDELVETYMIGAMTADTALRYFQRKPNKAVITGGDRADIQLAALQTNTRCLILTGNLPPTAAVLTRAVEAQVPIVVVREDTMTTVNLVERAFGRHRIASPTHIQHLTQMARQEIDSQQILDALPKEVL